MVDKELLLQRRVIDPDKPASEQDVRYVSRVQLDKGITVTVRGLRRHEVKAIAKAGQDNPDPEMQENLVISIGMIDPVMTVEEVGQWLSGAPAGDSVKVSEAIGELSGITVDAQKSRLPRNGRRP